MALEVLSLTRNIGEIDRVDERRQLLLDCYVAAIRSASDHAVRADLAAVESFRKDLVQLCDRLKGDSSPAVLSESTTTIATAQRTFQTETEEYIEELRRNLGTATRTVKEIVAQFTGVGTSHHESLQSDIDNLRQLQQIDDLEAIRAGLGDMASRMTIRLQKLQHEHQLAVAQLQDEIRLLHRQLEQRPPMSDAPAVRRAPSAPLTHTPQFQGMRRQEFEKGLRQKTEANETFCLAAVRMSNLGHLFTQNDPEVILEVMLAASLRLGNLVSPNRLWTRWEDDLFVVHLTGSKEEWVNVMNSIADRLRGIYRIDKSPQPGHVVLAIQSALVERQMGDPYDRILQRINQLQKKLQDESDAESF